MLATLVKAYEWIDVPIEPKDPIAFFRNKMEMDYLKKKNLIPYIGDTTLVSKV